MSTLNVYEEKIIGFVVKFDNLPKDRNSTAIQVHESNLKLILDGVFLARCDAEKFKKFLERINSKVNSGNISPDTPSSPTIRKSSSIQRFFNPIKVEEHVQDQWESHIVLVLDTIEGLNRWVEVKNCEGFYFAIFTLAPISCLLLFATLLTFELSLHCIFIISTLYTLTFTLINYWIFSEERRSSPKLENLKEIISSQLEDFLKVESHLSSVLPSKKNKGNLSQFDSQDDLMQFIDEHTDPNTVDRTNIAKSTEEELEKRGSPCRESCNKRRRGDEEQSNHRRQRTGVTPRNTPKTHFRKNFTFELNIPEDEQSSPQQQKTFGETDIEKSNEYTLSLAITSKG